MANNSVHNMPNINSSAEGGRGLSVASKQLKRRREFEARFIDAKRQRTSEPENDVVIRQLATFQLFMLSLTEAARAQLLEPQEGNATVPIVIATVDEPQEVSTAQLPRETADGNSVIIGPNGTTVKKVDFDKTRWISASLATRSLLMLVFDRQTLTTHTLSGKPSPAFPNHHIKPPLDPLKVTDVIHCIQNRFQCSEEHVRQIITMKCADVARTRK
uniref:BEN domain-containing protein n=1 Tax=Bactrocera latifrons TaxID=174628 RepID=A0A0K8UCG6_BACLA